MMRLRVVLLAVAVAAIGCTSGSAGGDATRVATPPGASAAGPTGSTLNPAVTQQTIRTTICVSGWTKTVRPPSAFTTDLKRRQIAAYGYADTNLAHYEEDHKIPLSVGGSPTDPHNLFPEPIALATKDDVIEVATRDDVCAGRITLAEGQQRIMDLKRSHGARDDIA